MNCPRCGSVAVEQYAGKRFPVGNEPGKVITWYACQSPFCQSMFGTTEVPATIAAAGEPRNLSACPK